MSKPIVPGFSTDQAPATAKWLGMDVVSWDREAGKLRVSFDPPRDVINFGGVVQGGFLVAMMDDAMGFNAFISLGMKNAQASIDIHTHFFRPVAYGRTEVEARIVRAGRSVAFLEAELFDKDGVMAARAVSSSKLTPIGGGSGDRKAAGA
ncbi:PaaI family thioesterase [Nitratireductor mangrovi]|uniref:PaaI family thioesterase n=1 Tax=Nitratireductor mangrovi TaxID=2599600 RepID=A0A5B8KX64_9HYPH|nr:PaaI family thioesterase [Nitratireductor mangrovi]QDZ00274.1 PaaI family thioesterase [Nitratireductor mangrovi]